MISNVYSYYLSQYANKPSSRFDSHKRSELRSTYNKLVNVNRTTPLYKLDLSDDMQKLAIDIKESAINLKNKSLELLEAEVGNVELRRKAESSDEGIVTAEYIGSADSEIQEVEVSVSQLAGNQVNTGHYLQPQGKVLPEGTYSFDVQMPGVTYELQFGVNKQDVTQSVQEKIVNLINKADIGLGAKVLEDSLGNTALSIESKATGIHNLKPEIFKITDEESGKSKGSVEILGLDRIVQHPSNAVFTVNGNVRTSADNSFTINKTVQLTLKGVSEEPVKVSITENMESFADDITKFVDSYNNVVAFARNASEKFSGGSKLLNEFARMTRAYRETLQANGLDINDEGKISIDSIDKERFTNKEDVANVLESLREFRNSVVKKADSMSSNPMEYLDKKIVAYKNPARSFSSPYSSSVYAGIMFDGYY